MPRKGSSPQREVGPDPIYQNVMVHRLINKVMTRGKKALAARHVYRALDTVKEKSGQDPDKVLEKALGNVMPLLEVRPRRVGGATYQVPVEVRPERRMSLGVRWIIQTARGRSEQTMTDRLSAELILASKGEGETIKKKEDTHRMAEANRAFAHYRW